MTSRWTFLNEANESQWIYKKKTIQLKKNPDRKFEHESDNASDTDKYGAVSETFMT